MVQQAVQGPSATELHEQAPGAVGLLTQAAQANDVVVHTRAQIYFDFINLRNLFKSTWSVLVARLQTIGDGMAAASAGGSAQGRVATGCKVPAALSVYAESL